MTVRTALVTLVLLLGTAAESESQQPRSVRRVAASGGVGLGFADVTCTPASDCGNSRESTPAYAVRLVVAVHEAVQLGVEAESWSIRRRARERHGDTLSGWSDLDLDWVTAVVLYHPAVVPHLFVKAGAGVGTVAMASYAGRLGARGPAFQLGAGYHVPMLRHLAVTPSVHYVRTLNRRDVIDGRRVETKTGSHMLAAGLALTVY